MRDMHATATDSRADTARQVRLINFGVADESFVLDIMRIRQIISWEGSTPVPQAPDFIEGIIVLRSEVIPIIDLRSRLFPRLAPRSGRPLVLVTRTAAGTIGLKVDEVRRIFTLEVDAILPSPPLIHGLKGELFIGVIEQKEQLQLLLDLEALLSGEEKESLETVMADLPDVDALQEAAGQASDQSPSE